MGWRARRLSSIGYRRISRAKWEAFDAARTRLKVSACFCSVLGECWTAHLAADMPKPVASCLVAGIVDFRESPPGAGR